MALMRAEFATPILMRLMAFWNFEVQRSNVMTSRNRAEEIVFEFLPLQFEKFNLGIIRKLRDASLPL